VLWAESEIVYFYAMKKFRTVGGKCGTGHSRRPLPFIVRAEPTLITFILFIFEKYIQKP
jgi:hypothetical protein